MKSSKPQKNDSDDFIQLKGPSRSTTQSSDSGPQRNYQQPQQTSTQPTQPIHTLPPEQTSAEATASQRASSSEPALQTTQSPSIPTLPLAQKTIPLKPVTKKQLSTSQSPSQIANSDKKKRQVDSKGVMPKSKRTKVTKDSVKKALLALPGAAVPNSN